MNSLEVSIRDNKQRAIELARVNGNVPAIMAMVKKKIKNFYFKIT